MISQPAQGTTLSFKWNSRIFVNYLTVDGPTDLDQVSGSVMEALMASTEDQSDLVSLSCMNVVMPTAMSTIQQQSELQENSRKTAGRKV